MNGYSAGRNPYGSEPARPSPPQEKGPNGRMLVEGYRKDIVNNFERDAPRYNLMNPERPQSSALVDLKDPIQVHLLTETALSDSKQYEILSQEEVDDLKKHIQSLTQRIEQTRTNLTIQSKYRDAAISMSKLYSPGKSEGKRRSLLGNRNSGGDSAREAELERQASERRCEELATELWNLEKRLAEPQRRLLEHTAGILQLTHKPSKKANQQLAAQPVNGIPGSPESLYRYSNSRSSMEPPGDDAYFDEQSLYQKFDERLPSSRKPLKNPIEIPLKSPHREQNNQLREASDRLKEENGQLRAQSDALSLEVDAMRRENSQYLGSIADMERKLERLNASLREVIVQFNPTKNGGYKAPPYGQSSGSNPAIGAENMLARQFDYLEMGLRSIREEQQIQASETVKGAESARSLAQAEGQVEAFNRQIRDLLVTVDPSHPSPPRTSGSGLDDQLNYLQSSLRLVETGLSRGKSQDDEQIEAVLTGLWDIVQTGFAGIQQRKQERRKTRTEQGLEQDEDDMSGDEIVDPNEPYSLSAFSKRVQYLYSQATSLRDQKSVLKRQIKQQRELNSKSDSQRDLELKQKQDEVEELKALFEQSEQEAAQAQGMLVQALKDVEEANNMTARNESSAAQADDLIKDRDAKIAQLEASTQEVQSKLTNMGSTVQEMDSKLGKAEQYVTSLTTKLAAAEKATEDKQQEVDAKLKIIKEKEDEIEQFNMTIVELKTELTIAQAELDGAYGSRKERAKEAAAVKSSVEVVNLQNEVDKLKEELAGTLQELENITKETIDAEREKLEAEGKLDDALANQTSLETEINSLRDQLDAEIQTSREKIMKLQEELDGERLKVVPAQGGASKPGAGASMLSEQFRATMREERKKFQEDLREEQARRRKLEEELQRLKKAQGPGKSPLSPR